MAAAARPPGGPRPRPPAGGGGGGGARAGGARAGGGGRAPTRGPGRHDLRDLLGALRARPEPDGPPPAPPADDLPGLIAESEAAGTTVTARVAALSGLPMAVRLAVHRIVQEALTNARKHAPGAPVGLEVAVTAGRVVIEVVNAAPPAAPAVPSGFGLLGVAERVAALEGALSSGRDGAGRFVLRAELPLGHGENAAEAGARTAAARPAGAAR
jgi:hypothetical protein